VVKSMSCSSRGSGFNSYSAYDGSHVYDMYHTQTYMMNRSHGNDFMEKL
jgi:outer membrane scaffolding protein for murein synthesis (MipA/OmpV family)